MSFRALSQFLIHGYSTHLSKNHQAQFGSSCHTVLLPIECVSAPNTTRSHSHLYCILFLKWKSRQSYPFTPAVPGPFFLQEVSASCGWPVCVPVWGRGWDTKARRPCFSGVAQSIGKTQTRLLYFSCLYCLPYYPKELSNTNCIRLLNPSHMHTRSKPPPFFMTLLSNICSSLTHVSPPRRPRGPFLPPPLLHNVQHSEVCKLSQSTHCSALHSCWLSTFHISHFFSKHIWI